MVLLFDARVQVLTEQEAYSALSFVADTGGILSLFIGINFLSVWDLVWDWIVKVLLFLAAKAAQ